MELATALIWALRIILPIILFCIYFKLQAPKEGELGYTGPTKNQHPRSRLLEQRKNVEGEPSPEEVRTITLVGPDRAPELFVAPARRDTGRRSGREREDRGDRSERKERKEKDRAPQAETAEAAPAAEVEGSAAPGAASAAAVPAPDPEEDKMHLESLLNYVAFKGKDQQRTFIIDESTAPPPPPPKAKKSGDGDASDVPAAAPQVAGETSAKANSEAQMVLAGATRYGRADVATKLFSELLAQDVDISDKTFTLMIESCVAANDLKGASDMLMKMEAAGHSPNTELLDKVMELYSVQKSKREQEKASKAAAPPAEATVPLPSLSADLGSDGGLEAMLAIPRAKLSAAASLFVPSFSMGFGATPPPPPNKPKPSDAAADDPFTVADGRTALKASSKAFSPQGTVTFNPYEYTWTVDTSKETEKGKGGGSKGRRKGGAGEKESKEKESNEKENKGKQSKDVVKKPQAAATGAGQKWVKKKADA